jgi:hypothetical protein
LLRFVEIKYLMTACPNLDSLVETEYPPPPDKLHLFNTFQARISRPGQEGMYGSRTGKHPQALHVCAIGVQL